MLFAALPVLLALRPTRVNPIPILLGIAIVLIGALTFDPTFDLSRLLYVPRPRENLLQILILLPVGALLLWGILTVLAPEDRFLLPRRKPKVWAMLLVLYPIASVIPQTIIYRVYFMHCYQPLFGDGWAMIVIATAAFALGHVIFRHPMAVLLTVAGGLLFCWRYHTTGSAVLSALEHALYGNLVFTIGYSRYLYHASTRAAEGLVSVAQTPS